MHCSGHHQPVSVLFRHPYLTLIFSKNFFPSTCNHSNFIFIISSLQVGPYYRRKTMTGLLASQGCRVAQCRVGESFSRVSPGYLARRSRQSDHPRNSVPYTSRYFGEKIHIDQNEKLILFRVKQIRAVDGYSGKIVAFSSTPIKNNISIYESIYM